MGTFAKIFIVVNLVLAVVFLGAASALLGTAESYKKQLETGTYNEIAAANTNVKAELDNRAAARDKAASERDKYQSDLVVEQRRATELEKSLATKNGEFQQIVDKYNYAAETISNLSKSIDDIKADYRAAFEENKKLQGQVDQALAEAAQAKQDADDLRQTLEGVQGTNKQLQADVAASEKSNTMLTEEKNRLANVIAMVEQRFGADAIRDLMVQKAVKGTVVGVDADLNLVLLSVGKDDEVELGYTFTVYRGGKYIGKLVIDKVGPDWASGHMDKGLSKEFPQRGDEAATQL